MDKPENEESTAHRIARAAHTPERTAQVQELHHQLFASSSGALRQNIKNIAGVEVRDATTEVDPATVTVVAVFSSGTLVRVYLVSREIAADAWNAGGSGEQTRAGDKGGDNASQPNEIRRSA